MKRVVTALIGLSLALGTRAQTVEEWIAARPDLLVPESFELADGLSVRLVTQELIGNEDESDQPIDLTQTLYGALGGAPPSEYSAWTFDMAARSHSMLGDGAFLVVRGPGSTSVDQHDESVQRTQELLGLRPDGLLDPVASYPLDCAPGFCGFHSIHPRADARAGAIWLFELYYDGLGPPPGHGFGGATFVARVWRVEGLPAVMTCPAEPGDLAPGFLDESTEPPTWRIEGDGAIDVADVLRLLRAAVGLEQLACTTMP